MCRINAPERFVTLGGKFSVWVSFLKSIGAVIKAIPHKGVALIIVTKQNA